MDNQSLNSSEPMRPSKSARLEARVHEKQKALFQRAADLSGCSLSDFVVQHLQLAALKVIEENEIIKLTPEDSKAFVEALLSPAEPNKRLLKAAKRHSQRVKDDK